MAIAMTPQSQCRIVTSAAQRSTTPQRPATPVQRMRSLTPSRTLNAPSGQQALSQPLPFSRTQARSQMPSQAFPPRPGAALLQSIESAQVQQGTVAQAAPKTYSASPMQTTRCVSSVPVLPVRRASSSTAAQLSSVTGSSQRAIPTQAQVFTGTHTQWSKPQISHQDAQCGVDAVRSAVQRSQGKSGSYVSPPQRQQSQEPQQGSYVQPSQWRQPGQIAQVVPQASQHLHQQPQVGSYVQPFHCPRAGEQSVVPRVQQSLFQLQQVGSSMQPDQQRGHQQVASRAQSPLQQQRSLRYSGTYPGGRQNRYAPPLPLTCQSQPQQIPQSLQQQPLRQNDVVDELSKTQEIYVCKEKEVSPAGNGDELAASSNICRDNISFFALNNSADSMHIHNVDVPSESPIMAPGSLILVDYHRPECTPEEGHGIEVTEHAQRSPGENVEAHQQASCSQATPIISIIDNSIAHLDCTLNQPTTPPGMGGMLQSISIIDNSIGAHLDCTVNQPTTPPAMGGMLQSSVEGLGIDRRALQTTPVSERLEVSQPEPEDSLTRTSLLEGQRTPAPRSSWRPSDVLPSYGLDAELKAKAEEKYNLTAEDEVAQWVEEITGVKVMGDFGEALRTGQVLCQLVNTIKPDTIKKINDPGKPFKERENITMFIKTCRDWGVHEYALFSTDDLYDEKNLASVVKCIYQLGGVLRRAVPEFLGPHLGVADCSNAKRDTKRDLAQASQTEGFRNAMGRSHIDIMSTGNVRAPLSRGGC